MNFEAVGGKGVILYNLEEVTRFEPVPMPVVEALCAAAWITDISIEEDITFNVAANDGEARETEVVVTYGEQKVRAALSRRQRATFLSANPQEQHGKWSPRRDLRGAVMRFFSWLPLVVSIFIMYKTAVSLKLFLLRG